jgi:hypothetical protein
VLIEPDWSFGGLEGFLDKPALTGHGHQSAQWHWARAVAAQAGAFASDVVAADQQMMDAGVGVIFGQEPKPRPGETRGRWRVGASGLFLPGVCWDQCE